MSNNQVSVSEGYAKSLLNTVEAIIADPSIPEDRKIATMIHLTALVCAVVAAQPIPFADVFILSPIQLVMVTALNRVMGNPVPKEKQQELLVSLLGVVGWGVLAQQLILGLYKTILPFMGGLTTIPLVYAATVGLGYAAKTVLDARRKDQAISEVHVRKIAEEAKQRAKAEKRDWSVSALKRELTEWQERAEQYRQYEKEVGVIYADYQKLVAENSRLNSELKSTYPEHEVDDLIRHNEQLSADLLSLKSAQTDNLRMRDRSRQKWIAELKRRYQTCYPSVQVDDSVFKSLIDLLPEQAAAFERQVGLLQHVPDRAAFRCRIQGTVLDEVGFAEDQRLYLLRRGAKFEIMRIGDKGSQSKDIEWLRIQPSLRA